jgi:hypothetical protein
VAGEATGEGSRAGLSAAALSHFFRSGGMGVGMGVWTGGSRELPPGDALPPPASGATLLHAPTALLPVASPEMSPALAALPLPSIVTALGGGGLAQASPGGALSILAPRGAPGAAGGSGGAPGGSGGAPGGSRSIVAPRAGEAGAGEAGAGEAGGGRKERRSDPATSPGGGG